jgi:hypothetical protein
MDNHVIKGRGENNGKYLCYARMAGLPPSDGYVWLPAQRKAVRWDDPRLGGWGNRDQVARDNNGYFVRLVARKSVIERVDELQTYISRHTKNAAVRPSCYWLDGDWSGDEGPDYCWECATKEVDKAYAENSQQFVDLYGDCHGEWNSSENYYDDAIRGGWSIDHSHTPYCDNDACGKALAGTLTEDGADEELAALTTDCAPTFDDAEGWYCLSLATMNLRDDDPWWNKIARVVDAAMEQERRHVERQAELAKAPGMTEVRDTLLGLLLIRKEQKAPEPSFPLWNELLEWRKRRYEEMYLSDTKDLRKALLSAAKKFAANLGYKMKGDCIDAPYGDYIWHFTVVIEQYRLWQPKAFIEGRDYMLHPCPSGDPNWPHNRDDNPYPKDAEEHVQWDCGYVSVMMRTER